MEELEKQIIATTMGQSAITARCEHVSHKDIQETAQHISDCYNRVAESKILLNKDFRKKIYLEHEAKAITTVEAYKRLNSLKDPPMAKRKLQLGPFRMLASLRHSRGIIGCPTSPFQTQVPCLLLPFGWGDKETGLKSTPRPSASSAWQTWFTGHAA